MNKEFFCFLIFGLFVSLLGAEEQKIIQLGGPGGERKLILLCLLLLFFSGLYMARRQFFFLKDWEASWRSTIFQASLSRE